MRQDLLTSSNLYVSTILSNNHYTRMNMLNIPPWFLHNRKESTRSQNVDEHLFDKLEAVIRYGLACQRSLKVPNGFHAALHRKCHSGAGL